ncbi:hypothetical protein [Halorientalis marina]|uniref:hypothetical protein n=1 Tax=Halorientalis marina TaxID=2931976 RepID=UPI001FF3881B|nr:hypothetical protein [Halorientalis marina]
MSFFPRSMVVSLSPYFAALVDGMHALVVMIFTYWIFSEFSTGIPTTQATLLAGAVFVLMPKLVTGRPLTARLRLGGRAPGALLLTVSVMGYVGYSLTGQVLLLVTALVGAGLVALTSSFSTQTLVLLYIAFSILFFDPVPIVILFGGGSVALLLSRGKYVGMFQAHVGTLRYYYNILEQERADRFIDKIQNIFYIKARLRNFYLVLREGPPLSQLKSKLMNLFQYVYTHPVVGAYLQLPIIIFIPLLVSRDIQPIWNHLLVWVLVLLVVNVIIAIPGVPGKPAHRYTEYLVAPLSILGTYAYFTVSGEVLIPFVGSVPYIFLVAVSLALYSLGVIVINSAIDVLISPPDNLTHAIDYLAKVDDKCHILGVPSTYGKRLLPDTDHVQMQCIHDHFATADGRCECGKVFAFIGGRDRDDLQTIHDQFRIDYILGDIQQVKEQFGDEFELLFESGSIGVYAYESADQ